MPIKSKETKISKPTRPRSRVATVKARVPELVQVRINPASKRQNHTVAGITFKASEVREYDLSDPAQRRFVDDVLRKARKVSGREDTPLVFVIETAAEAQSRARSEAEKSRAPRGTALSPIRGRVPSAKVAPSAREAAY